MTTSSRRSERGAALIFALLGMTILIALGAALILVTSTETMIAANFRNGRQAAYAAEAIAELAFADLQTRADWAGTLDAGDRSSFVDGAPSGSRSLPLDAPVDLTTVSNLANCGSPTACGGAPAWQMFAYGPLQGVAPLAGDSPFYVAALVRLLEATPTATTVQIRGEAFGPRGVHRAIELTVSRAADGTLRVLRTVAG